MAFSEIADFIGAYAGFVIAFVALVLTVIGFMAIARMGSGARPSADKK